MQREYGQFEATDIKVDRKFPCFLSTRSTEKDLRLHLKVISVSSIKKQILKLKIFFDKTISQERLITATYHFNW